MTKRVPILSFLAYRLDKRVLISIIVIILMGVGMIVNEALSLMNFLFSSRKKIHVMKTTTITFSAISHLQNRMSFPRCSIVP